MGFDDIMDLHSRGELPGCIAKLAYQLKTDDTQRWVDMAVHYGQFYAVKWFHEHGIRGTKNATTFAIKKKYYKILEYLTEQGYEITGYAMKCILEEAPLRVINWARCKYNIHDISIYYPRYVSRATEVICRTIMGYVQYKLWAPGSLYIEKKINEFSDEDRDT
jgi:hypothetical protein